MNSVAFAEIAQRLDDIEARLEYLIFSLDLTIEVARLCDTRLAADVDRIKDAVRQLIWGRNEEALNALRGGTKDELNAASEG